MPGGVRTRCGTAPTRRSDEFEEDAGLGLVLLDMGDVVEDEEVIAVEPCEHGFEGTFAAGDLHALDEIGGSGEQDAVWATSLGSCAFTLPRPCHLRGALRLAQPDVLPGQRPGRVLPGFRCQSLLQPRDLVVKRFDRAELARPGAGFREQLLQTRHFGQQGRHVPGLAAKFLGLLLGLAQPLPAGLEPSSKRLGWLG